MRLKFHFTCSIYFRSYYGNFSQTSSGFPFYATYLCYLTNLISGNIALIFNSWKKNKIPHFFAHTSISRSHFPVDTGRKVNIHKTFRRRRRLLNVLCTFNLRPVSTGFLCLCNLWHGKFKYKCGKGGYNAFQRVKTFPEKNADAIFVHLYRITIKLEIEA